MLRQSAPCILCDTVTMRISSCVAHITQEKLTQEVQKLWSGVKPVRPLSRGSSRRDGSLRDSSDPSDLERSQYVPWTPSATHKNLGPQVGCFGSLDERGRCANVGQLQPTCSPAQAHCALTLAICYTLNQTQEDADDILERVRSSREAAARARNATESPPLSFGKHTSRSRDGRGCSSPATPSAAGLSFRRPVHALTPLTPYSDDCSSPGTAAALHNHHPPSANSTVIYQHSAGRSPRGMGFSPAISEPSLSDWGYPQLDLSGSPSPIRHPAWEEVADAAAGTGRLLQRGASPPQDARCQAHSPADDVRQEPSAQEHGVEDAEADELSEIDADDNDLGGPAAWPRDGHDPDAEGTDRNARRGDEGAASGGDGAGVELPQPAAAQSMLWSKAQCGSRAHLLLTARAALIRSSFPICWGKHARRRRGARTRGAQIAAPTEGATAVDPAWESDCALAATADPAPRDASPEPVEGTEASCSHAAGQAPAQHAAPPEPAATEASVPECGPIDEPCTPQRAPARGHSGANASSSRCSEAVTCDGGCGGHVGSAVRSGSAPLAGSSSGLCRTSRQLARDLRATEQLLAAVATAAAAEGHALDTLQVLLLMPP